MKELTLISGPCVIEDYNTLFNTAKYINYTIKNKDINFYFKSSCVKDNRTSINNYSGIGFKKGIKYLLKIKKEFGFKITTDFHTIPQLKKYGKKVDLIQIPAYLAQQTSLITEASKLDIPIHIKKPQFLGPVEVNKIYDKLIDLDFKNDIIITDRGTMFGYDKTIVDPRHYNLIKGSVLADVTHINKNYYSNNYDNSLAVALSAIVSKANGIFLETADNCSIALCDKGTMLNKDEFDKLVNKVYDLWRFVND